MKTIEKKAVRLVASGAVAIGHAQIEADRITYAQGTVDGDHGRYIVTIQPDGDTCDCVYGLNRPGQLHAHTIALRLAVWNQQRKVTT